MANKLDKDVTTYDAICELQKIRCEEFWHYNVKAIDLGIKALSKISTLEKENEEYKERYFPKSAICTVVKPRGLGVRLKYQCPNCGEQVITNYCPNCGQAIDWSEWL